VKFMASHLQFILKSNSESGIKYVFDKVKDKNKLVFYGPR